MMRLAIPVAASAILGVVAVHRSLIMIDETGHTATFVVVGIAAGLVQLILGYLSLRQTPRGTLACVLGSVGFVFSYTVFGVEREGGDGLWVFAFLLLMAFVGMTSLLLVAFGSSGVR